MQMRVKSKKLFTDTIILKIFEINCLIFMWNRVVWLTMVVRISWLWKYHNCEKSITVEGISRLWEHHVFENFITVVKISRLWKFYHDCENFITVMKILSSLWEYCCCENFTSIMRTSRFLQILSPCYIVLICNLIMLNSRLLLDHMIIIIIFYFCKEIIFQYR